MRGVAHTIYALSIHFDNIGTGQITELKCKNSKWNFRIIPKAHEYLQTMTKLSMKKQDRPITLWGVLHTKYLLSEVESIHYRIKKLQKAKNYVPSFFLEQAVGARENFAACRHNITQKTTYTWIAALERSVVNINTGTWGGGGQLNRFYWYQIFNQGSYAVNMRF